MFVFINLIIQSLDLWIIVFSLLPNIMTGNQDDKCMILHLIKRKLYTLITSQ